MKNTTNVLEKGGLVSSVGGEESPVSSLLSLLGDYEAGQEQSSKKWLTGGHLVWAVLNLKRSRSTSKGVGMFRVKAVKMCRGQEDP